MTECERLIDEGVFSPDFFLPEVRCDFLVDEKRKKIWAVELDILLQIDRVCRLHSIEYFLICGSLLGAVRHKGVIPWDDDIDICMKRPDYERFLKLSSEFTSPYLLQIPGEDGCAWSFAKVVNCRTTGASKMFAYAPFVQGIGVDIFPLDGVVYEKGEEMAAQVKSLNIDNSTCLRMSNPHLDEQNQIRVRECKRRDPVQNLAEIDRLARQFNDGDFSHYGLNTINFYPFSRNTFLKEDFDHAIQMPFEHLSFPVPCGYDDILKTTFHNYMEFPPVDQRGVWHGGSVFEPDIPYDEWVEKYRQ